MTTDKDMDMLDTLFSAERSRSIDASPSLMDAVMADARGAHSAPAVKPTFKPAGVWTRIRQEFAGWQMISGLAACAVLGIGLGYSQPFGDGLGVALTSVDDTELAFGLGDLFDEEFLLELDT